MVKKNSDAAFIAAIAVATAVTLTVAKGCVNTPKETLHDSTTKPTVAITTNAKPTVEVSKPTTPIDTTEPIYTAEPIYTTAPIILYDVPLDTTLQLHIIQVAEAYGIDPAIIFAMIYRESTYNPSVIGDNGEAFGLMQVQPKWHSDRMARLGCTDLLDPFQNVVVGIDYLAEQKARYGGDMSKALVAYNAGHYYGTITRYAQDILAMAEELRGTTYEADE